MQDYRSIAGRTLTFAFGISCEIVRDAAGVINPSGVSQAAVAQLSFPGWRGRVEFKTPPFGASATIQTARGRFSTGNPDRRSAESSLRGQFAGPVSQGSLRLMLSELHGLELRIASHQGKMLAASIRTITDMLGNLRADYSTVVGAALTS